MTPKKIALLGAAAALLAGCADYAARDRAARTQSAAPTAGRGAPMEPITNAGQTTSPVSGSVSNSASGSQATPTEARPLR